MADQHKLIAASAGHLQVSICGAWFQLQGSVSLCKSPSKVFAIETRLGLLQQAFHRLHVFRERSPRVCLRAKYCNEHAYVSNPTMHQCACLVRKIFTQSPDSVDDSNLMVIGVTAPLIIHFPGQSR